MTDEPWLSVIMPTFQGERWIDESLTSIETSLAAEAPAGGTSGPTSLTPTAHASGVEVLIVDQGPGTATLDIARRFSDRLRLRTFHRPELTSWHAKTNFGVEQAAAPHLCWLGVDDVWLPGRAAAARAWLDADPAVELHLGAAAIIDERSRPLGRWRCPLPAARTLAASFLIERLLVQNFVAAPAPVFSREAYLRCGGLDESLWYTADWDLWLKLAADGAAMYHDEVTVGFRVHAASLTSTGSANGEAFADQMHRVLDRHLAALDAPPGILERTARASIGMNTALAAAARGRLRELPHALSTLTRLGPKGLQRYFRDSRIHERLLPRIRARLRAP